MLSNGDMIVYQELSNERRDIRQSRLAPIRRLPLEIISFIFILCLPETPVPSARHAPLLLMQVDKHWRTVALSTPQLWSTLYLDFGRRKATSKVALGKLWFDRSRATPLFLTIKILRHSFTHPFVKVIVPHVHRIKELEIHLPNKLLHLLEPAKGCFSSLQSLSIRVDGRARCDLFAIAPELTVLHIHNPIATISPPIPQIVHCRYEGGSIPDVYDILRQSINLQDFEVIDPYLMVRDPLPHSLPPVASHLHTFTLRAQDLEVLSLPFTLPDLRNLAIRASCLPLWPSIMSLLDRSSCHSRLERLALTGISGVTESVVVEFLALTPSLAKLEIGMMNRQEPILGDLFLDRLTGHSSMLPLLPNMTSLSLESALASDDDKLADMIEARLGPANGNEETIIPLRHFELKRYDKVNEHLITRLRPLRMQGLDVLIRIHSVQTGRWRKWEYVWD
jgi:hypothetical protein